jgi:DNA photolyase
MRLCWLLAALELATLHFASDAFAPVSQRLRNRNKIVLSAAVASTQVDSARIRQLNSAALLQGEGPSHGKVCYWMWREQRCADNWALLHAQQLAEDRGVPLHVGFCLPPRCGSMTKRHYSFMLAGKITLHTVRVVDQLIV